MLPELLWEGATEAVLLDILPELLDMLPELLETLPELLEKPPELLELLGDELLVEGLLMEEDALPERPEELLP